uniref:Multifunctional fusion protein n=1 Tax=uncultured bacterium W4-21b TaxID=1130993 RepID=H9BWN4_9BACT|nr:protein-export membrane protein SecD [uncultured bacterium W4-21b]
MDKYYKWKATGIVLLIAFALWQLFPIQKKVKLGLDLKGGMHLLMRVDIEKIPEDGRDDAVDRALEVIRNRIDQFGVSEPVIQKQGKDYIVIQLPGVTDRKRALDIIGKTAHLEFKLVATDEGLLDAALEGDVPEGYELKILKSRDRQEPLLLEKEAVLTGDRLVNATVTFDQTGFGQPVVSLEFDREGARKFTKVTQEAVRKLKQDGIARRLAIVLDGELRSAPRMQVVISDGRAQVEGNFQYQDASDLALVLRAGTLPAPVILEEDRIVGPSLGRDSIERGAWASIISGVLISLFMMGYYLLPGIVASIALFLMLLFTIGGLAAFGAILTLPGIAGLVLNIGMAVDANVLIFERIREEIKTGKPVKSAVSVGYNKALSAILDANVTTFITALLLFYFGSGPVKGFAITLSIGIVASMISALVVTRLIFDFLNKKSGGMNFHMLNFIKETPKFNFMGRRPLTYGVSAILIVGGLTAFFMRGASNYGVDFAGGVLQQVRFQSEVPLADIRRTFARAGLAKVNMQNFGEAGKHEVLFRSAVADPVVIEETLSSLVGEGGYEILRSETVGPAAGAAIRNKAIKAFTFASIAIILYMTWRFGMFYGFCAVLAVFHDVLVCMGFLSLFGREFTLPVVSALMAVMGYSLNDTIVVFDRVRENKKIIKKTSFAELVNTSLNQTLSRTLLTSMTTLMVAVVLFLFGGGVINDFAFTLIIGVIAGTYSTIFIASAVLVDWHHD